MVMSSIPAEKATKVFALSALMTTGLAMTSAVNASINCSAPWTRSKTYQEGNTASRNGVEYRARWLNRDENVSTHHAWAQAWIAEGACENPTTSSRAGAKAPPPITPRTFVFSPYKDATINLFNRDTFVMGTKVAKKKQPLVGKKGVLKSKLTALHTITLAFATGTCEHEKWGRIAGEKFARANIGKLEANHIDYIIATGGAVGSFRCTSAAGLKGFIKRYSSANLIGLDFDIERGQSDRDIQNLVQAAAGVQSDYPSLRFSFTLTTDAATDGSHSGLNGTGDVTARAIFDSALKNYTINLMTMDYTPAISHCALGNNGLCDMGASAIQAVENLRYTYGIPFANIAITPMIGQNDEARDTLTLRNVDTIVAYARANNLAGLHFWSFDRDTPCTKETPEGVLKASPTCHAVDVKEPLAYTNRVLKDLKLQKL